jgi:hypothetical protein
MNFKEMCAQKRDEKDRDIVVRRDALHWLAETLSVLQELPHLNLITDGPRGINVLRDDECICKVKIETGRWKSVGLRHYHVMISRHAPRESSSFHQIETGVQGHKELREAIQFWLAQMVVDNNWDQTTGVRI